MYKANIDRYFDGIPAEIEAMSVEELEQAIKAEEERIRNTDDPIEAVWGSQVREKEK